MPKVATLLLVCAAASPVAVTNSVAAPGDQQAVDICEIVRHAERYRGSVLTITGLYATGLHGSGIYREHCGFRNRYRLFGQGASAQVDYYDLANPPPKDSPGPVDLESIRNFVSVAGEALNNGKSAEPTIQVTVVGLVNVAPHYSVNKLRNGDYVGTGFGEVGLYPVQVFVLSVENFSITNSMTRVPKPKRMHL